MSNEPEVFSFDCPSCGDENAQLEVVSCNAIVSDVIVSIDSSIEFETGTTEILDYGSQRFQCLYCGYVIAEDGYELDCWLDGLRAIEVQNE